MTGLGDPPIEPLRQVAAVDGRTPILLTGLSVAAVLGASGDLSLIRETRGADIEWGGVYGQGVRLSGAWWTRCGPPGQPPSGLAETLVNLESSRTRVASQHEAGPWKCDQEIVALSEQPGVGRRLTFSNTAGTARDLWVETAFRPELAPVLIEGVKPLEYELLRTPAGIRISAFGCALEFGTSDPSPVFKLNDTPWDGGPYQGRLDKVTVESTIRIAPAQPATLSFILWGGVETYVREHPEWTAQLLAGASDWAPTADASRKEWTARTPRLRLPAAPEIERGYLLARDALRSLYFSPGTGIVGLVAGYPWYAALWCRDLAWMLPAVLWLGDTEWAAASLRTVFRFQARTALQILGGAAGELPMQIGASPIFLYGTSDTTLYYPALLRRYLAQTGDETLVRELAEPVERAEEWARHKTDPATGLIRNGDEDAGLRSASREHGRVHYGFDAPDATIWDSTDRRSFAIDNQVLWADALSALAELAPLLGLPNDGPRWAAEAQTLRDTIAERYWWPEENYLYDSRADNSSPVRKVRPNALRAVAAGLLSTERAAAAVERAAQSDLATDWGYRTLSSKDPTYNPIFYHDGQVWPIATSWAISAAFTAGQTARALDGLRRWAIRLDQEAGTLNECYRGDRAEPYDSCFLLGFSIAPFLTILFDDLWGLHPRWAERTLVVAPHFLVDWSHASLEGLSLFGGQVTLRWERPQMSVAWEGAGRLRVLGGRSKLDLASGSSGVLDFDEVADTP